MLKVGGWLGGSKLKVHGSNRSLNALDELTQIEDAMAAVSYIMEDDVDGAEEHLSKGSSPFHLLGRGVVTFMRATLGFEQEVMREAAETLSAAENAAYEHQRHAGRTPHSYQSPIYPPGTEYGVCQAQAQLMSAIVGVLNESLTEAIKSFYKLRKAFLTLEAVMDAEKRFLRERSTSSLGTTSSETSAAKATSMSMGRTSTVAGATLAAEKSKAGSSASLGKEAGAEGEKIVGKEKAGEDEDDSDDDFVDADEEKQDLPTPEGYMGQLGISMNNATVEMNTVERDLDLKSSSAPGLPSDAPKSSVPTPIEEFEELTMSDTIREGEDASIFGDHPVDVFIISGSNFCFGILLLLISLVPPAFATLLKIVGFKGDRERGLAMLWQATKFHNIHGAMAGLVLFGFYNGLSFCDIIPQRGEGSYPKERCAVLLAEMRRRHPGSHLFLLEESRVLSHEKELEQAVDSMTSSSTSPLKQLEALRWFERSLATMFLHRYEDTSTAFLKCVTLNNWSHAMYYYVCGAAHVEIYRRNKSIDPKKAEEAKSTAADFFKKVVPNTGRKKFMAKQLPFDVFVTRKIQKWEQRANDWSCDIVDAVGVSPIEEMIFFWAGYKRMKNSHLQISLDNLAWSESKENPYWEKEGLDEKGVLALLRAAVLRCMDETDKAKGVLRTEILAHDKNLFKGPLKDSWTAPCARYEMAANVWREADREGRPENEKEKLEECKTWLEEVSRWESYDLDARTGMKITTGKATLRRYGIEC
ncbi:outer membrane protein Iml2/Tetratricopeptide repeat protein 39 [Clohesyomyces aquaticus]|uniref:Inclusion body clearance protein IML2 n=1 Tax=Clohesyomyces aquaticus TaxID=1231657 RepID=A0A1Y1Y1Z2_9PLEO|nr:outer membrane protein Iml2/Tetratricopeptide repeat protein 39 [Clohesyomyces aquaticus]